MKRPNLSSYALAATLAVALGATTGISQSPDSEAWEFDAEILSAYGLDQLDEHETENLVRLFASMPYYSFLEESAARRLEQEGWQRASVFGPRPAPTEDDACEFFGVYGGEMHLLDSSWPRTPLLPGLYWIKPSAYTCRVLQPDGSEETYWLREVPSSGEHD